MPDKPAAEVSIDEALVRRLLVSQATGIVWDAASLALEKIAEGWDNEIWRLGEGLVVRLPRRALAAPLVVNEQRVLPSIARRLAPAGVRVPAPIVAGRPDAGYPWHWSVVPWIDGVSALDVARPLHGTWAETLADTLGALHVDAPQDFPPNPVRGVPLAERDDAFVERLAHLQRSGRLDDATADAAHALWRRGVHEPPWTGTPVWIHGDLHPGNLVCRDGLLTGIIDFGDVTAGDPAYDLAAAWLAFDMAGRARFTAATGSRYDAATWRRAHAWAAAVAVLLIAHSDDNPPYTALGRETLAEVLQ